MVGPIAAPAFSQRARFSFVKIPGIQSFGVMYNRRCMPFHWSTANFGDQNRVRYQLIQDRFKDRQAQGDDILWWNANSNSVVAKRVVRSWLSRRLRVAMKDALEANGLDERGKAITAGAEPIAGTLQLFALAPLVTAKMAEVERETQQLLDFIRLKYSARKR